MGDLYLILGTISNFFVLRVEPAVKIKYDKPKFVLQYISIPTTLAIWAGPINRKAIKWNFSIKGALILDSVTSNMK